MKKIAMLLGLAMCLSASLGATTLQYLMDNAGNANGCLVDGDKQFCDFFGQIQTREGTATPFSLTQIDVSPIADPLIFGINIGSIFAAVGPLAIEDIEIRYTVTVLDPSQKISGVGLHVDWSTTGGGFGNITETLFNPNTNAQVGQAVVQTTGSNTAFIPVDPSMSSIRIAKDIGYFALNQGDTIAFSLVDQTFTQVGENNVPEPGTYAMMGAGLLALAAIRRRKA